MPAIAITDHGNVYGAYDFWSKARPPASSRSSASRPTSRPSTAGTSSRCAGARPAQKDDDVSGAGAYTHMTLLAESHRGHAQPVQAGLAGLARGLLPQAADGPRAAVAVRQGHHRHHRLRRRRGADQAAARPVRPGPGSGGRLPRHLRPGQFLRRADAPWPGRRAAVADGLRRIATRAGAAVPGHQRLALHHARPTPPRTRYCCACRPARTWPTRTGSGSRAPATTSRRPQEMRALAQRRGLAGRLRQHAADRRAGRGELHQVRT